MFSGARVVQRRSIILTLGLVALTSSCYQSQHKISNGPTRGETSEDRIGIDDVFDVRVYGEADLSGSYRVANDGTVDYPLAGRLKVSGLRTGEIQQLIVTKLADGY